MSNRVNFFLIGLLLIIIVLMVLLLTYGRGEGSKCLNNPIGYGIEGINKAANTSVVCSCSASGFKTVIITDKGVNPLESIDNLTWFP